ncbi:putative ribonuclease H-like domain-containing protein [Tanacetum coccineum]
MKQNGVTYDALHLFLFPYSLTHHATAWFDRLPNNSIHTFEEMLPDESLFEAWERYKLSIDRCPNHNMLTTTQIDTFYNGLTLRHQDTINADAGGFNQNQGQNFNQAQINAPSSDELLRQHIIASDAKFQLLEWYYFGCGTSVPSLNPPILLRRWMRWANHGPELRIIFTKCNVQKSINPLSGSPTHSSDPVVASLSPSLTPFGDNDFLLEDIDALFALDDSIPPEIDDGIFDLEGDVLLLEKLLNNDSTKDLPPKELKNDETKMSKYSIEEPPDLELKDLPPLLGIKGPVTADEKTQKKNDVKARSMLLMALPNEHLLTFNQYKDAKTLFAAIQTTWCLPSEWYTHVVVWRNKPDLDTMSFDDLYNNFKIVEQEVKGTANSSSSSSSQNMAFVSSPSSTNEVNTAYEVNTANTKVSPASTQVSTASTQVSTANLSDATVYAFLANQPNGSQLVHEDLEQIHEDDLEEMDLKWQLALLSMRTRRGPRNQDSRNWNQDSSRRTINVEETSSKAMLAIDGAGFDWSYMADDEFPTNMALMAFSDSEPEFEGYGPKPSKSVSEDISNEVRESPDASLVKELVLDDKLEKKTIFLTVAKIEFVRPKQQEKPVRKPVKYAKMYRLTAITIKGKGWPKAVNTARPNTTVVNAVRANQGHPQKEDQGYVYSGCSRHMTGNMSYLSEFKEFDGGYVAFGGGAKGGKITGKGTLKTDKLDFKDVYFVKELLFNLFSVSHICDKKNNVLFTDTGCFVLSPDFKLADESQVLLKVPRKNNMYSVDIKNIAPKESLTCLVAKATLDESMLWHRRLGKQHKASCKSKIQNSISQPLFMLHMDLFGPTFVSSLMHKKYCLVVTDDYSRFTWVFFLASKDETSGILKSFITQIENLVDKKVKIIRCDNGTGFKNRVMSEFCEKKCIKREFSNRVLVVKPHNKTPYKLFRGRTPSLSFMRPFGCHVTILNTLDHLGKFDGKFDDGFFVRYLLNSKAFRVYNIRTRKVEENLHVRFLEDKPIIAGDGPKWLFDIDVLTKSMNYVPVVAGSSQDYILMPLWKDGSLFDSSSKNVRNDKPQPFNDAGKKDDEGVIDDQERPENSAHDVNIDGPSINTASTNSLKEEVYVYQPPGFEDPDFPDKVYKVEKALYGLHQALRAWYETISTYLLDNGFQRGQIDKTLFIKRVKGDILLVQVYVDDIIFVSTRKELCTEFKKIMHKRFQMSSMGELTFFLGLQVTHKNDRIFVSQDKYVDEILKKFGFSTLKTVSTPMETSIPLLKDAEAEDVDVHLYRSMIGSLMYLTVSRPDIMFVDSPFNLEAYTNSDYAGASLDRKSTTRVLWIQNQMLDYGYNFMNTKIFIDNESTICIVKNPVFHSKTKHIEIKHHFIRELNEKKLIQMIKIHTDLNVADLLTKAFDVGRFQYLTTSIGILNL